MSKLFKLFAGVIAVAMFVGCEEKKEGTSATGSGDTAAPSMMDKAKSEAAKVSDAAGAKAAEVKDAAVAKAGEVKEAAAAKVETAKVAVAEKAAEVKDAAAGLLADPSAAITKIKDYLGAGKATEADGMLKSLEGLKDKLPDSIKSQLPGLREMVDKGLKGAAGLLGK